MKEKRKLSIEEIETLKKNHEKSLKELINQFNEISRQFLIKAMSNRAMTYNESDIEFLYKHIDFNTYTILTFLNKESNEKLF